MCGICGKINFDSSRPVSPEEIKSMNLLLHHRGPDEEGYYFRDNVALGHKRLSIIDLKTGKQPISNEDESCVIIFNGEIYNFLYLRESLIKKGHVFKTNSDTETILHLYEEYGKSCVELLRGMFAFAIWDHGKKECFIARDRVGKKPLYYALLSDSFVFASELKALLALPGISREIDYEALNYYLSFQYVPAPHSIFKSIKKLEPAHTLVFKNNNISLERYWDLSYEPKMRITEKDALEQTDAMIDEAVRIRLLSEVPLGCFLSGGVDSSAIVGYMRRHITGDLNTFSIGFEEETHNELPFAQKVAQLFETKHQEFVVRPDAIEVLPKLVWHFDEPYADSSALPTYYLSKMTRQYVTVALNGDGGDESFIGYERYVGLPRLRRYMAIPRFLRVFAQPGAKALFRSLPDSALAEKLYYANTFSLYDAGRLYLQMMTIFRDYQKERIYSPRLKHLSLLDAYQYPLGYYNDILAKNEVEKKVRSDIMTYLHGALLPKVDRTTMANSLEGRAPFLDYKVMEYAARLPLEIKFGDGILKYHLKKVIKDLLPHDLLWRKKQGFGVPVGHWFKRDLYEFTRDIILSQKASERDIFDMKYVAKILEDHRAGRQNHHHRLWALLCLELWFMTFIDRADISSGPLSF
ncbi:asparagine synthase (glutamine-hydrolyzing) [Candidatus Sumerlaeota bacterium]|nr:asparagine synthase (glutamine-hydrolyzing) [Candidatus Sumerlaeota bacterium]